MNKQTVVLIALFAGLILTADMAGATAYEDIAGQWCGDVTDYVFTPDTLTVKFHDSRPANASERLEKLDAGTKGLEKLDARTKR